MAKYFHVRIWVAINKHGAPFINSVSHVRADAIQAACSNSLGCSEYLRLGTDQARWKKVYRMGVRVRRAWIVPEEPRHD